MEGRGKPGKWEGNIPNGVGVRPLLETGSKLESSESDLRLPCLPAPFTSDSADPLQQRPGEQKAAAFYPARASVTPPNEEGWGMLPTVGAVPLELTQTPARPRSTPAWGATAGGVAGHRAKVCPLLLRGLHQATGPAVLLFIHCFNQNIVNKMAQQQLSRMNQKRSLP